MPLQMATVPVQVQGLQQGVQGIQGVQGLQGVQAARPLQVTTISTENHFIYKKSIVKIYSQNL